MLSRVAAVAQSSLLAGAWRRTLLPSVRLKSRLQSISLSQSAASASRDIVADQNTESAQPPVAHSARTHAPASVFASKLAACGHSNQVLALFNAEHGKNPSASDHPRISAIFGKLKAVNRSPRLADDARLATLLEVALSLVPQQNLAAFTSFLRSCNSLGLLLPVARLPSLWVSSASLLTHARASELTVILDAFSTMRVKPSSVWFATFWKSFQSALSDCRVDTLSVTLRACVALNAGPPSNLLTEWMRTSQLKGDSVDEVSSSNVIYACALFSQWPSSTAIVPIWSGLREKHFVMFSKFQHAYLLAAVERPGILPPQHPSALIRAAQYVRRSRSDLAPSQPVTPLEIEVASLLTRHGFAFEQRTWCDASAVHIALALPAHRIAIEVYEPSDFNISKDAEASPPAISLCGSACMRRRLLERCGKWRVVSVSSVEWAVMTDEWDDERPARVRQALIDSIRELVAVSIASRDVAAGASSAAAEPHAIVHAPQSVNVLATYSSFASRLAACVSVEQILALFAAEHGRNQSAFDQPLVSAIFQKLKANNCSNRFAKDARLNTLLEVATSLVSPQQNPQDFVLFLRSCNSLGLSLSVARLPSLWVASEGLLSRAKASELTDMLEALCKLRVKPSVVWFASFWKAFQSTLPDCRVNTLSITLRACVGLNKAPPSDLLAQWLQASKFNADPLGGGADINMLYACALFSQWSSSSALVPIWNGLREEQFILNKKFHHAYLLAAAERPGILRRQHPNALIKAAQFARSRSSLSPSQPVTPLEIEMASLLTRHGFAFEQRTWCDASAVHIALTLPAHRIAIEINELADFNVSKHDESSAPKHRLTGMACMRRRLLERCGKWRVVSVSSVKWAPATADEWDDERPARVRQALIDSIRERGAVPTGKANTSAKASAKQSLPRAAPKAL